MSKTQILDNTEIQQKLLRISHQLHERFYDANEVTLIGIKEQGANVARDLSEVFASISGLKINAVAVALDKENPRSGQPQLSQEIDIQKPVILVDDVLNSGRTLTFALMHLLNLGLDSLHTVVLIDRRHRKFPIRADYVGMTLATTLQEHISVELNEAGEYSAFLE